VGTVKSQAARGLAKLRTAFDTAERPDVGASEGNGAR